MNSAEKIEYQLSPEMAEKLAIEQIKISSPNSNLRQLFVAIFLGIIFAFFFVGSNDYSPNFKGVLTLIVFCFGFAIGLARLIQKSSTIKQRARSSQQRIGASRTINWDNESITFSSSVYQTRMKWQLIDKIISRKNGIHLISNKEIIFSIPKSALPQPAEELIKAWNQPIPVV
jgi:YcxB-like protein